MLSGGNNRVSAVGKEQMNSGSASNFWLNPTVGPVTALADASAAPAPPAG